MASTTTTPVITPTQAPTVSPAEWPDEFTDPARICPSQRRTGISPDLEP